ncbi:MAG: zinc ribbon domain-containing protein [Lachnospiraceae bacterium]|nr:zinc ribbon domain-containing protein [Lachnospiraceae bacterium]
MSKCKKCKVNILDKTEICPLCKCVVEQDENSRNIYPDIRFQVQKLHLAVRIFLFIAIILEVLLVYLNQKYYNGTWWSVITGAGFAYVYFLARFVVLNDNAGYRTKLFTLIFFGILYVILIDYIIGYHGWSVNFVLPGGLLFVDVAIVALMFINRRNWQSYIMLEIAMIFLSAIPLFLMRFDIVTETFISGLAFAVSVFVFLGTFIIGDRRARIELKRRFHVR